MTKGRRVRNWTQQREKSFSVAGAWTDLTTAEVAVMAKVKTRQKRRPW